VTFVKNNPGIKEPKELEEFKEEEYKSKKYK